ncbi:MAG: hypothetical protein NNA31_12365 [Nitrospira sp.]|nr:hypothetical protein [Nitrospira sp.]
MRGWAGDDRLFGGAGHDVLEGGTGDDQLWGGTGHDRLTGGAGHDHLLGLGGDDRLNGGRGHDRLEGGAGADTLRGGPGEDYLDGGPGADILIGGPGHDTYVVDHPDDQVIETHTGGLDTVHAAIDYTLGAHVEDLILLGTDPLTGIGNEWGNVLRGNDGDNVLIGRDGDDYLAGGLGDDTYRVAPGDGRDVIAEIGGAADRLVFEGDRGPHNLILSRQADDLRVLVAGGQDSVTIRDWFRGLAGQVETLDAGGQVLHATQVDQLLQAMAQFTTDTGLAWEAAATGAGTSGQQAQFQAILAAHWQGA